MSLDSASVTFFQNAEHSRVSPHFPEIADCFLIVDSLQELALIRERIRSRQQGVMKLISASSHEQKQVIDFIFGSLFNQKLTDWFQLNNQPKCAGKRMGSIHVKGQDSLQLDDFRILPSGAMVDAAKGFFALWGGARDFLQEQLFASRESVSLSEAISKWAIDQAVCIAALTDLKNWALDGYCDWPQVDKAWHEALARRSKQVSFQAIQADSIWLIKIVSSNTTSRTKQLWFFRSVIAMLTNAIKNCPPSCIINCQTEFDREGDLVRVSVLNSLPKDTRVFSKTDGTNAVLELCAEAFGGRRVSPFRFACCDKDGIDRPPESATHWISEATFPIGLEDDGAGWITPNQKSK